MFPVWVHSHQLLCLRREDMDIYQEAVNYLETQHVPGESKVQLLPA